VSLSVKELSAGYGDLTVIRDISFTMDPGETVAVIGANGAGKTTLLWALAGLIKPMTGNVMFGRHDITGLSPTRIVRLGIGHVLEGMHVFSSLTVEDNLLLGAFGHKASGQTTKDRMDLVYKYFPVLDERRKQTAGSLSGGEKQMLAIGRTLMQELKLLFLDEPSAGLAPLLVLHVFDILHELRKEFALTILLVEQNAEIALDFADRGLVLSQGRIMLEGPALSLRSDAEVKRIYLGGNAV
jgi:branched-chain amino acid transport system ATP-binding protein